MTSHQTGFAPSTSTTAARVAQLLAEHSRREEPRPVVLAALEADSDEATLLLVLESTRAQRGSTIVLPAHQLEGLSRGRGWCRSWGAAGGGESSVRVDRGYAVGPGSWIVGASVGYSRTGQDVRTVEHVTLGAELWTIAT